MHGENILARSLSVASIRDKSGQAWQYHSQSDRHSKLACWGVLFDLLIHTPLLQQHAQSGKVAFGINHKMVDFEQNRSKNLDLVLCRPQGELHPISLSDLVQRYDIKLGANEKAILAGLPALYEAPIGSVLLALEAKATMTAHQKALPRLYDELNSSHATIHGSDNHAIAVGLTMVNYARSFLSPNMNKNIRRDGKHFSDNRQPHFTDITIAKIKQLPRRSSPHSTGYDALSISVVEMINDGSPVTIAPSPPSPPNGDIYSYPSMISRVSGQYSSRFSGL